MRLLHVVGLQLESRSHSLTFGYCEVIDLPFCRVQQSIQTTPNSELRKVVNKMKDLLYEQEQARRDMDR